MIMSESNGRISLSGVKTYNLVNYVNNYYLDILRFIQRWLDFFVVLSIYKCMKI
jgi:hypothetical protein